MSNLISRLLRTLAPIVAIGALIFAMGGTWSTTTRVLAAPVTSTTASSATSNGPGATAKPTSPPTSPPASPATPGDPSTKTSKKDLAGKLNLNTASEMQLMMLPTVGPSKADRIVTWRKKNGGFKRTADLRRVKGFGYRTFKRLEPFLDITGETTLVAKR